MNVEATRCAGSFGPYVHIERIGPGIADHFCRESKPELLSWQVAYFQCGCA
jgi:hypothetical protein